MYFAKPDDYEAARVWAKAEDGTEGKLLATYDAHGRIHIKARDRYWHVQGVVQAICPRCGSEHALDPRNGSRSAIPGGAEPNAVDNS